MNTTTGVPSRRGSGWGSEIEKQINRVADALMAGGEKLVRTLDRFWASLTRRSAGMHA